MDPSNHDDPDQQQQTNPSPINNRQSSPNHSRRNSDVSLPLSAAVTPPLGPTSLNVVEDFRSRDVFTFGQNSYGELAHGDTTERHAPNRVEFIRQHKIKPIQVVAGNEHTAILCENGDVYTCGYNDSGQCGVGTTQRVPTLKLVESLSGKNIVHVYSANGCEHLIAVSADGLLYTCGYNARGQLGHDTTTHIAKPKLVNFRGKRVVKVACSYYHSVVSTDEGEVYSFGRNDFGQLGLGDTSDKHSPTRVESIPMGIGVLALACGQYHTLISLDQPLGVMACGKNDCGQLGTGGLSEPRHVPVALADPLHAGGGATVVQIACGYYHTVCLTSTGEVFSFGRNDYGQLGLGNKENKRWAHRVDMLNKVVTQVSCGCYHSLFLSDDGMVFAVGRNNHGQLGTNTAHDTLVPKQIEALESCKVSCCAAGFYHSICLSTSEPVSVERSTLSLDLKKLLNNKARSDVTFVVEGRPIYAHRCILMARCEPLEKMLEGPMREANQNEIELHELQHDVFLALLEFLYTDTVESLFPDNVKLEFALDLLVVADQFLVDPLKRLCEAAIQKSITVENVAMMLRTADARQALALRKKCFDYVLANFGKVIGTNGFAELPRDLLAEVCAAAAKRGVYLRS